jgi:photosystem II stability/assembly factor-like uncharacterized protein
LKDYPVPTFFRTFRFCSTIFGLVASVGVVSLSAAGVRRPAVSSATVSESDIVPGVVVVKLRGEISQEGGTLGKNEGTLSRLLARAGVTDMQQMFPPHRSAAKLPAGSDTVGLERLFLMRLAAPNDPRSVSAMLSRAAGIEYAEPKYMQWITATPRDPRTVSAMLARAAGIEYAEPKYMQWITATPRDPRTVSAMLSCAAGIEYAEPKYMQWLTATPGDPQSVSAMLSRAAGIEYAEPKYMQWITATPNDPHLAWQNDALSRMNVFTGWGLVKGSPGVPIADIDGGTDWRHEDLLANVHINALEDVNKNNQFDEADINGIDDDGNGFVDDVVGWNFTNDSNDPRGFGATPQSYAHGTATASHFGAVTDNNLGMAGSSWNCSLLPVCTASPTTENGIQYGYEGVVYAFRNGAKVINCSWGRIGGFSRFEQDVITAATSAGALVVAAAGNENLDHDISPHYPSNYRGVLAVGAVYSTNDEKASFSNYGVTVPVYAPGVNIFSAFPGGGYGNGGSGTSYSSPLVAGLAGLIIVQHPDWTPARVAAQIRSTADAIDAVNPVYQGLLGRGRVNFARALTESHPALDLASVQASTPDGRKLFLVGDTIVISAEVRNPMSLPATSVQFTVTASNSMLQIIAGTATVSVIAPDEQVRLPDFRLRVGELSYAREVAIRIRWQIGGSEGDGDALRVMLFPSMPVWLMDFEGTGIGLFSVKAVTRDVAWAAGGNALGSAPMAMRTVNGGQSWTKVTGNMPNADLYCVTAIDQQRAWAGTGDGRIVATVDGGSTWTVQSYPGRQSPFINAVWMFPDGTGYAQGDPPGNMAAPLPADSRFIVLKTTDFGVTWAHLVNEPPGNAGEAGWNNSFWWTDAAHGWFGTNSNRVWRTTDGGVSWGSAPTGSTNSYGVAFSDVNNGLAVHDAGAVSRTSDGGVTWSGAVSPTTDQCAGVALVAGSANAWVTSGSTPYQSRNGGVSWSAETLFPFTGSISHLSFADTMRGWAVTSDGEVLRYDPSALTPVDEQPAEGVPELYRLEQNFPNPFNPSTTIVFHLPESGRVTVTLFDLLGREVRVLADADYGAGVHRVKFDGSGLASGAYVYGLVVRGGNGAETFRRARTLLLIR